MKNENIKYLITYIIMMSIEDLESISLSNVEVMNLIGNKANIIQYPELRFYENIDDILEPYGACIILFLTRENYGHWTCVFKVDENTIEYFDPYGLFIDEALDFKMNEYFRYKNHQNFAHLTWLLLNSRYEITYNEHKFQQKKKGISTCGRHTAMRLILRELSLEEYKDFIYSFNLNPDKLVTLLTIYIN